MAFRGLQAESNAQAQQHLNISTELTSLVADPFAEWAKGYKVPSILRFGRSVNSHVLQDRVMQSKGVVLNQWLFGYEHNLGEVAKLKHQYLDKVRKADEAEDEYVIHSLLYSIYSQSQSAQNLPPTPVVPTIIQHPPGFARWMLALLPSGLQVSPNA